MNGGFSFCGIDIADIGIEYAPEQKDTYVYAPAIATVHEETFEGHDGGYTYGSYKEPKVFTLRCFYEEKHIARGVMAKFYNLFRVGKSGILIFKRRPWCYYYATVTDIDADDMRNYMNGLIVITMKAYYPFARGVEINGRMFSNLRSDPYHDEIMLNTGLLDHDNMEPPTSFGSSASPITEQTIVPLFNPGTENAKVSIMIAGQAGDGVTIYNRTTDQTCRYVAFNTTQNDYVFTDGINGKTVLDRDGNRTLAFLYHDYGFIELAPAFPIRRELYVTYSGSRVTALNMLYDENVYKEWYEGKYIYLGNKWYKILRCIDEHTIELTANAGSGNCMTSVVKMNEIVITPTQGSRITKLNFVYKPTFA